MATHCYISVEVPQHLIGKTVQFDRSKMKQRLIDIGTSGLEHNEASVLKTQEITINGKYLSIYQHWDSQLLEEILPKTFNNVEDVVNLMLLGDCSSIGVDEISPYICRFNGNMDEWEEVAPQQSSCFAELPMEEYNYIFKDGKWQCLVWSTNFK